MSRSTAGRIGPGPAPQLVSGPNPPGTEELAKAIAEESYWDWSAEDVRRGCRRLARKYLTVLDPILTGKQSPAEPQGDVEEVLAKLEYEAHLPDLWDSPGCPEPVKERYRSKARKHLAAITPLLALEVKERLAAKLGDPNEGFSEDALDDVLRCFDEAAALDTPAPSEPSEKEQR